MNQKKDLRDVDQSRISWFVRLVIFIFMSLVLVTTGTLIAQARHVSDHPVAYSAAKRVQVSSTKSTYAYPRSFSVLSRTLEVTVPLGTRRQVQIDFTNVTSETMTPVVYEAWPAPPTGAMPRVTDTVGLQRLALPDQELRVDPQIMADMAASSDGETEFLVFLNDQADLSHAYTIADWGERGGDVYQTLTRHAERSQRELRVWLDARHTDYQPLWMMNALVVEGNQADVEALQGRAEVALLRANHMVSLEAEEAQLSAVSSCDADANGVCWNIKKIGADRVWHDFGVSGVGATVAHIDSGANYEHPALVAQYRGVLEEGGFDHNYNWFDAVDASLAPKDAGNHGTHTMGTMLARSDGSSDQPAVGVAPGAQWIAARGCGSSQCSESDLITAAQWLLAPADLQGKHIRPDLRPHVVNNSWASAKGGEEQYLEFTSAWRAAGIFPVFSAGNSSGGVSCGSIVSPGDYSNVVGVGATDQNDQIAYFSRVGPTSDGRLKPDISAPGVSIASTYARGGLSYGTLSGTSMAAPHVAGAVALLWSANPSLVGDYAATYDLLTQTAVPRTDKRYTDSKYAACSAERVPNNIYGYGRLDVYAAVAEARVDVPWLSLPETLPQLAPDETARFSVTLDMRQVAEPGDYHARLLIGTGDLSQTPQTVDITATVTITDAYATVSGVVRDEETGLPVRSSLAVSGGPQVKTDADGAFAMKLPAASRPSTYTIAASATGYVSQSLAVTVTKGVERSLAYSLTVKNPRIRVEPSVITTTLAYQENREVAVTVRNDGTLPLDYTARVPLSRYSVWRSDETDGLQYQWIDMPAGAQTVKLADDAISDEIDLGFDFPLAGQSYNTVKIGSNGVLVLGQAKQTNGFLPRCPPIPETEGAALMPLRSDLDPSQGGRIRTAQVAEGFVVTYDTVPLHDKETTFTFQVLLHPDGNIRYSYEDVGPVPNGASMGVQFSRNEVQTIGCEETIALQSFLTLELRPQPVSWSWMTIGNDAEPAGVLEPGEEATIPLAFQWLFRSEQQPYLSGLEFESNDPRLPVLTVPVHTMMLPLTRELTFGGDESALLSFNNTLGLGFSLDVLSGTVKEQTTIIYTEIPTPTLIPEEYHSAGHTFLLEAYQGQQLVSELTFAPPLNLTLEYDDSGLDGTEEQTMALFVQEGDVWKELKTPSAQLSVEDNALTVHLEEIGTFGLFFTQEEYEVYIPQVKR